MQLLVVMVCEGNVFRSVVAEQSLRAALKRRHLDQEIEVASRGIAGMPGTQPPRGENILAYTKEWPLIRPAVENLGIDLTSHVSRPLDEAIMARASLVLAIDRHVLVGGDVSIISAFPYHAYKARLYGELKGTAEDMENCSGIMVSEPYRRVAEAIHHIATDRCAQIVALARMFNAYHR
jgi:protein-tyrosine-phosphatase